MSDDGRWAAPAGGEPLPGQQYGPPPGQQYGPPAGQQYGPPPGQQYGPPPGWGPATGQWAPPPPKPGVVPLRPLGVGEILDGAITAFRTNPKVMIGLSVVLVLLQTLLQIVITVLLLGDSTVLQSDGGDDLTNDEVAQFLADFSAYGVSVLVLQILTTLLLTGFVTVVLSRAVLGRSMTLGEAWQQLRPRLLALFGVTVLVFLVAALVVGVAVLPGIVVLVAGAEVAGIVLIVLGGIAGVLVVVYLYYSWALVGPIVVLERSAVLPAFRRSRTLVRRSWWRVFGILLLTQIVGTIVSSIFSVPFSLVASGGQVFTGDGDANPFELVPQLITGIGQVLGQTITLPFVAAVTVLLYVDLRMRREGLDLELQRAAGVAVPGDLGGPGSPAAQGPAGPAGPAQQAPQPGAPPSSWAG